MEQSENKLPQYWDRLNDADKQTYMLLRNTLSTPTLRNRRNKSAETFTEIIESLKQFVMRGDSDDKNRALVCGIYWFPDSIAVNTQQLMLMLSKCKSSINNSFQLLGYGTIPTGANASPELIRLFPEFKNNYAQLRQWTIRQMMNQGNQSKTLLEIIQRTNQTFYTPPPNQFEVKPTNHGMSINLNNQFVSAPPPEIVEPPKAPEIFDDSTQQMNDPYAFENDDISNFALDFVF